MVLIKKNILKRLLLVYDGTVSMIASNKIVHCIESEVKNTIN